MLANAKKKHKIIQMLNQFCCKCYLFHSNVMFDKRNIEFFVIMCILKKKKFSLWLNNHCFYKLFSILPKKIDFFYNFSSKLQFFFSKKGNWFFSILVFLKKKQMGHHKKYCEKKKKPKLKSKCLSLNLLLLTQKNKTIHFVECFRFCLLYK